MCYRKSVRKHDTRSKDRDVYKETDDDTGFAVVTVGFPAIIRKKNY